jgi:hypothetical protein
VLPPDPDPLDEPLSVPELEPLASEPLELPEATSRELSGVPAPSHATELSHGVEAALSVAPASTPAAP